MTYDVDTTTREGVRRLRRVAKACEAYGQRVQKSVFEVTVTLAQRDRMMARLLKEMDPATDSLRVYALRGSREECVETHGRDGYVDFEGPLIW